MCCVCSLFCAPDRQGEAQLAGYMMLSTRSIADVRDDPAIVVPLPILFVGVIYKKRVLVSLGGSYELLNLLLVLLRVMNLPNCTLPCSGRLELER